MDLSASPEYAPLLSDNFSPLAHAQSLAAAPGSSLISAQETLQSQQRQTSRHAHTLISGLQPHLLSQLLSVRQLDASLQQAEDQVREMKHYMHTLRTRIRVPFVRAQEFSRQNVALVRAQKMVASVGRVLMLVRRLRAQDGNGVAVDWPACAATLAEIDRVIAASRGSDDPDGLTGIVVVQQALDAEVRPRRAQALETAAALVDSGMQGQQREALAAASSSDLGAGLLIWANLGVLPAKVATLVRRDAADWAAYAAAVPLPSNGLWLGVGQLADELLARAMRVRGLERALARRRHDAVGRFGTGAASTASAASAGLDAVDAVVVELGDRVLAFWWRAAVSALGARLLAPAVRPQLVGGLPRLLGAVCPTLERLGGVATVKAVNSGIATDENAAVHILWDALLTPLAREYMDGVRARMRASVDRCVKPSTPPAKKAVAALGRCIVAEVRLAEVDERLATEVVGAGRQALAEFMAAAEARMAQIPPDALVPQADGASSQADTAGATAAAGLLGAAAALRMSITECDRAADLPLDIARLARPLMGQLESTVAQAIVANDTARVLSSAQWLAQHQLTGPLADQLPLLVHRMLLLYTHTTCLAYPLTEDTKLRIAADATQFEFACSQLVASGLSDASGGDAYAALRMLRPLLFMDTAAVIAEMESGRLRCFGSVDLANHVVLRLVSEASDAEALLGCAYQQWREMFIEHGFAGERVVQMLADALGQLVKAADLGREQPECGRLAQLASKLLL
ncbi:hypothetical protein LPJ66_001797 [Kickxella alabastrina]|uniref:Uncharacterized protein n=1 Tax=Kickxella alabastrina TaxID=61397 RepID=A0ACC1IS76_9FUNG|nr:hypothetical protein LPJ66_001797 [Kickxella alabastrina]